MPRGVRPSLANGDLRDHGQLCRLAHAKNRLLQLEQIRKGLENEQIGAAFRQRERLFAEERPCFVHGGRAVRLDAEPERTYGAGHVHALAPPQRARFRRRGGLISPSSPSKPCRSSFGRFAP